MWTIKYSRPKSLQEHLWKEEKNQTAYQEITKAQQKNKTNEMDYAMMQNDVKKKIRKPDSYKEWLKPVMAEFWNAMANKGPWMELSDLKKELENKGEESSRNKDSDTIANRPHVKAWWGKERVWEHNESDRKKRLL